MVSLLDPSMLCLVRRKCKRRRKKRSERKVDLPECGFNLVGAARSRRAPRFHIPFKFSLLQSGLVHGLAFWFDMAFKGSKATVWLSTAPTEPVTRWSQVRCLFHTPLFAKMGQTLTGTVHLISKNRESYDIHISATIDQSGFSSGNILELKTPFFS
uniref:Protein arginine N-methyltransferase domain-containing protein n=1 Tax=Knipowitschia caucasica TaxID=637954 RepID=A0AAV2L8I2_KNICA